jgi:hypothetical protein
MPTQNNFNRPKEEAQVKTKCESAVLEAETLSECQNQYSIPMGRTGPLVAKVPVVLSDVEIQIDVEAEIRLGEAAFDIKNIDKHICLTQCKLVPHTDKLFIAGYIQKNIQYSTIDCSNSSSLSGSIQHTTVNVPFKCVTKIQFSKYPIYGKEYKKKLNAIDDCKMGKDLKEDSWIHYSKFYEPVYCELEYAKILETDIHKKECSTQDTVSKEKTFRELVEKMVIYVRLKVLQNQQVYIPEPCGEVKIIETCSSDSSKDKSIEIEVGNDPKIGIVGKEVTPSKCYED